MNTKMNANDKIIRAKVSLQREKPFFAYLTMGLTIIEKEEVGTAGVNHKGELFYNPKFIDSLDDESVKTLLAHEILHVALLHLLRLTTKERLKWNVATDLVINNMLLNNGFRFSDCLKNGLVPQNNEYIIYKKDVPDKPCLIIENIDKKVAEEIYNELHNPKAKDFLNSFKPFDVHIELSEEEAKNMGENEIKELEGTWKERLVHASTYARMQGKEPNGLSRYIDDLLNPQINWREKLYKYITSEIPFDYSYSYPSKRSVSVGVYMPKTKKENIDISVFVDSSGSISKQELTEFLSELTGIITSFDNITLHLVSWDTEAHTHQIIKSVSDTAEFELKGGGGTSFEDMYSWSREQLENPKIIIFFTDGYATFPSVEEIKTIWVISKDSAVTDKYIPFGEVIRL